MSIKLYHGDCLKLMNKIPNKSVDLILADLPYGVTKAKWDSNIPLEPLWKQYKRIIKDHGTILLFGTEPFSSKLRMSNLRMYRYDWIWRKTKPTLFIQAHKMPMRIWENIMVFYKHLPTYNPQFTKGKPYSSKGGQVKDDPFFHDPIKMISLKNKGTRYPVNLVTFKNVSHVGQLHPTQKPTDLLRYLIRTYTNKNDLVLDNVMGSGSTGVAAKQLHRNFIGMEINSHYFNVAKKRIEES